jgi:beta-glucanase (GH16 family)
VIVKNELKYQSNETLTLNYQLIMRNLIIIFILSLATFARAQTFCEWQGKTNSYGAFPASNTEITTGWTSYAPFTDEFTYFDSNKWEKKNSHCHSMSSYAFFSSSSNNVFIQSGKLILKAKQESTPTECCLWGDPDLCSDYYYSSGYVVSKNTIRYGYIEIKCYLPTNIALDPCFWMYGMQGGFPPDPNYRYDEIDVFEKKLPPNHSNYTLMQNFYHNIHDDGSNGTVSKLTQNIAFTTPFVGQWVTFAVEWLPEEINFFTNGHLTKAVKFAEENSGQVNPNSDFTCTNFLDAIGQKFQISLSVNSLISTYTDVNQGFEIEYVRSYKLVEGFNYEYWPSSFSITDPNMFKVHKNIRLGGTGKTAVIPQDENITVWATDGITLDKGFTVSGNTTFTARNIVTTNLFNY